MPPSQSGTELGSGHALCWLSPGHFLLLCFSPALNIPAHFLSHLALPQEALKVVPNYIKIQTANSASRIPEEANISFFYEAHVHFLKSLYFFRAVLRVWQN